MSDEERKPGHQMRDESASAPPPTTPRRRTGGGRGRPFQKGNKAGVGHGRRKRDAVIDEFFEGVIQTPDGPIERRWALVQRLYASAMDVRHRDHPRLLELAVSYYFGKPRERVEMSGPDGGPIRSEDASRRRPTTGEMRKRLEAILAKREAFMAAKAAAAASGPTTNGHNGVAVNGEHQEDGDV